MRGEERGKQDVSSALDVGAGLQLFLIAVQYFPNEALEKELRGPGIPVAQNGIHPVGGEVPLPGVQPHDGLALAACLLLAEGHHPPCQAPARPGGVDAERVDDGHLVSFGGECSCTVRKQATENKR